MDVKVKKEDNLKHEYQAIVSLFVVYLLDSLFGVGLA